MSECYKICAYYNECLRTRVFEEGEEVQQAGELLEAGEICAPMFVGGYSHCAVLDAARRVIDAQQVRGEKPRTGIMMYFWSVFQEDWQA